MNNKIEPSVFNRRNFVKILSAIGATGFINPPKLFPSFVQTAKSRLVIVEDKKAINDTSINKEIAQKMVDDGVRSLTNINDIGKAWKSFFPNISSKSIIAIKVNCRFFSMPTHPEVTYAVVNGLKKMIFDGTAFPENNIIIYDNFKAQLKKSGYTINTSEQGVRCFSSDTTVGYSEQSFDVNGTSQRLSKVVTEIADYLINISVLKNHDSVSGVTLCLKNHFGTCDNPRDMHSNSGDPFIAELNALPPIKEKQCVNICDALFGIRSGGPDGFPQFKANVIIMSKDIVAVDYWGRKILENNGCKSIKQASHIDTAATKYKLGTNDPSKMEVINI
jgi:uncharacterized protein (DUF362 family)